MTDPRSNIGKRIQAKTVSESKQDIDTKQAFRKVAKTPEGQLVLRWFMDHCGFKYSSLAVNAGSLDAYGTVHNEAKRAVWLFARENIPWNLLNVIEAEERPEERGYDE